MENNLPSSEELELHRQISSMKHTSEQSLVLWNELRDRMIVDTVFFTQVLEDLQAGADGKLEAAPEWFGRRVRVEDDR
jgi:hypothetical protein